MSPTNECDGGDDLPPVQSALAGLVFGHLLGRYRQARRCRADPGSATGRCVRHGVAIAPLNSAGDGGTEWPLQIGRHRRTG